jgi:NRPS condensation-like uncharacterized protein
MTRPASATRRQAEATQEDLGEVVLLGEPETAPTTSGQDRLWYLEETGFAGAYNVPLRFVIDGDLDIDRLRCAAQLVVDRHDILRTTLGVRDGGLVQVVHPAASIALPVTTTVGDEEAVSARLATHGFRLEGGALSRWNLLQIGERRHVLSIVLHHAIYDSWSGAVLVRELSEGYADPDGLAARPRPVVSFQRFARWQRE